MNWKLPNQLTVGRIVLAAAFFVLLGLYVPGTTGGQWTLNIAFVVYLIAGVTDVLDGYLARRWKLTSEFGRIVDPFVDKVLVVGAYAMLAGSNFMARPGQMSELEQGLPVWMTGSMLSAVQAWMVVVIIAREMIVSAVRGYSESQGTTFPATSAGKLKMFVQSFAICAILFQLANARTEPWAIWLKVVMVWLSVAVTVLSGLAYVGKARKLLLANE